MSEINETPNSYTTNLLEQIMVSDCFSKTNVPEIKRSTFDLYVKNIIKLLDIQKTPYLSIGVNDLEKYELLGDSNHLNDVSQLISNFIDLHCWIETIDGEIIDEHFEEYDVVKQMRNLTGDKVYCELVGEEKKNIWKYIYKNHIKKKK